VEPLLTTLNRSYGYCRQFIDLVVVVPVALNGVLPPSGLVAGCGGFLGRLPWEASLGGFLRATREVSLVYLV